MKPLFICSSISIKTRSSGPASGIAREVYDYDITQYNQAIWSALHIRWQLRVLHTDKSIVVTASTERPDMKLFGKCGLLEFDCLHLGTNHFYIIHKIA